MSLADAGLLLASYLLGAIPFGYLIAKARSGADIRSLGSGNIGATNVLRTQGKRWGILTLALDAAKAAAPVFVCARVSNEPWMGAAGGAAAVVGHCFPVYIGFRGGKGIASGLGAFLGIAPAATLVALAVFILEILTFRTVSLGSISASLTFGSALAVFHWRFGWYDGATVWIGAGVALLLVARHHQNIRNLIAGTESKLWGEGSGG